MRMLALRSVLAVSSCVVLLTPGIAGAEATEPPTPPALKDLAAALGAEEGTWSGSEDAVNGETIAVLGGGGLGAMSTCTVGIHPGDSVGGNYATGVLQTASAIWLQASTDCPSSTVQQVRTYVSVGHYPYGFGTVHVASDSDSDFPVSYSATSQIVPWYDLGFGYYGPPSRLRYCYTWGYVDYANVLTWRHRISEVDSGLDNWSSAGWQSGRCF